MSNEWRRIVAALANPEARAVYAALVLSTDSTVTGPRRAKALVALVAAGLVTEDGNVRESAFADLLAAEPAVTRQGIERFLSGGRITQYPAKPALRLELLEWVASRVLGRGENVNEAEISERLSSFTDDVASLRRYLVDAGLLTRSANGTNYSLS
ncbi:MAG: DUF2087 domain-containing protein [Microbacteriaceae bacterium]